MFWYKKHNAFEEVSMAVLTGLPRRIVEQHLVNSQQAQEIINKAKQDKISFVAAAACWAWAAKQMITE